MMPPARGNHRRQVWEARRHQGGRANLEELEAGDVIVEGVNAVLVVLGDGKVAVALDLPLRRLQLPRHQLQQRRLACAVFT